MSASDRFKSVKQAVLKFFGNKADDNMPEVPLADEDPQKTHEFVQQLFDEGLQYENDHFASTPHLRLSLGVRDDNKQGISPEGHRMNCDHLAAGNLWEVIGHRNVSEDTRWKSEIVEGLVQRNMRIRGSFISSAWHDITIVPNIQYADDIFNQERKAIGWGKFVDEYREVAQRYGVATSRVYFEDNDEDLGHVRVAVIKPGTFVRTPNSMSFEERDGCWYVAQGTMINEHQLRHLYPDLEDAVSSDRISNKYNPIIENRSQYNHTKMFPKIEVFMDDDTFMDKPVKPEEEQDLATELEALSLGTQVPRAKGQNGKLHVGVKTEALNNFLSTIDEGSMTPEDEGFAQSVIDAFSANIDEHTQAMDDGDPDSLGLVPKYPFGRYICSVGGQIAEDIPNPNYVPWRSLFEELKNEKVYGRNDGRGDPEIYFHDEKTASRSLSQFFDTVVLSMPKRYRGIEDKENKLTNAEQEDNDPQAVGYYVQRPPVSISGAVSQASLEARQTIVDKAQFSQGVNTISMGAEPQRQSSGFQTQLLQRQNEIQVSGELDRNMRSAIENIVETILEMYKVFYGEPRIYTIAGAKRIVNVKQLLSEVPGIDENGQPTVLPNPKFEITAKPFSNYPNRFESELSEVANLYTLKDETGVPLVPSSAIYEVLALKYPQAAPGGDWQRLNEATRIGLQVLAEQQAQAQAAQAEQDRLAGSVEAIDRKAVTDQYKQAAGLENNNGGR